MVHLLLFYWKFYLLNLQYFNCYGIIDIVKILERGDKMNEERNLVNILLLEKKHKISGGIYHKIQVDFAYNSNHIEGSRLTKEQTRFIFETHSVDGSVFVNDIIETANHFRCFDFILDTLSEPITEEFIKKLHYILKNGVMGDDNSEIVIGDYKKYANVVGEIMTAKPKDVPTFIQKLLHEYSELDNIDLYDIAKFHVEFEKIHPFYDGNGRVGRLLILKMCLMNNIVPFIINEDIKNFYYMGLKEWQVDHSCNRLLDVFLSMQDDMKAVLDYFEIVYKDENLTARELMEKHS